MAAPRPRGTAVDVWVTRKTKRKQLYNHCNELLLNGGHCRIHGLGAAMNDAIRVATELERRWLGTVTLSPVTSSVALVDDHQPLTDDAEQHFTQRFNSAIVIDVRVLKLSAQQQEAK